MKGSLEMKTVLLSWITATICLVTVGSALAQENSFQKGLSLYRENKLSQALPEFESAAAEGKGSATVYAWLAETLRRLGKREAALAAARKSLRFDPRNSFAHLVIADVYNPTYGKWDGASDDSTWANLMEAVKYDPSDGNAWIGVWVEAIKRNDIPLMEEACSRLIRTGFLTGTVLSYARWTLRSLPRNAIIITNGDMDTFPLSAIQVVEGFRRDVAVVNRSLLNTSWYARYVREYERAPVPPGDTSASAAVWIKGPSGELHGMGERICQLWLTEKEEGKLDRPLAVSVTVKPDFFETDSTHMDLAGPYYLWVKVKKEKMIDTTLALASFKDTRPADFAGAWVSSRDRSPLRIAGTKMIVLNIIYTAYMCSRAMMTAGNYPGAAHWADWAEELDNTSELGPVWAKYIGELKDEIRQRTR